MATERRMLHRDTGQSASGYVGFSWTTLFWGPLPALFRGDFLAFLAIIATGFILFLFTNEIGGIAGVAVWSFMYNDYYTSRLERQGYEYLEPYGESDHPENSGVDETLNQKGMKGTSLETARTSTAGTDDPYANRELNYSDHVTPPTSEEPGTRAASQSGPKRTPKQAADLQRHLRRPKGMLSDEGTPIADMSKSAAKSVAKFGCGALVVVGLSTVLGAIMFAIEFWNMIF